jgi:hypothetical protein
LRKGALHRVGDFGVLGIDDASDLQCRFQVQVGGGAIGLLGGKAAQVLGRGFSPRFQTFFS